MVNSQKIKCIEAHLLHGKDWQSPKSKCLLIKSFSNNYFTALRQKNKKPTTTWVLIWMDLTYCIHGNDESSLPHHVSAWLDTVPQVQIQHQKSGKLCWCRKCPNLQIQTQIESQCLLSCEKKHCIIRISMISLNNTFVCGLR